VSKDVRYLHMCVCTTCVASVVVALHALIHSRARVCVMILSVVRYTSNQVCVCYRGLSSYAKTTTKTLCRSNLSMSVCTAHHDADAREQQAHICLGSFTKTRCPCVSPPS